jgi:hypothetical protein
MPIKPTTVHSYQVKDTLESAGSQTDVVAQRFGWTGATNLENTRSSLVLLLLARRTIGHGSAVASTRQDPANNGKSSITRIIVLAFAIGLRGSVREDGF